MSQITLYLDDATQALVDNAARANGVSKSRWVADIIRKYAAHLWPDRGRDGGADSRVCGLPDHL